MKTKFDSDQCFYHNLNFCKIQPIKQYTFARLHCGEGGINLLFDTMRYEGAFFTRKEEVIKLLKIMEDEFPILNTFDCVLGAYGKHTWTHERLMSMMKFEELLHTEAFTLPLSVDIAPSQPLRYRSEITLHDVTPAQIVQAMCINKAYPVNESEAGQLLNKNTLKSFTLGKMFPEQKEWRIKEVLHEDYSL